jgi:hypothetical protein
MPDTSILNGFSHMDSALLSTNVLIVGFITLVVYKVYNSICICQKMIDPSNVIVCEKQVAFIIGQDSGIMACTTD